MESQAAGPGAGPIRVPPVLQRQRVIVPESVVGIADELPVHQILGFHERESRAQVHRGAAQVIGVSHANDRGIRNIRPNDGVPGKLTDCLILRGEAGQKDGR